jgi:hypothetical protein
VKVFYVTHLFDLAHGFYREQPETALDLDQVRRRDLPGGLIREYRLAA